MYAPTASQHLYTKREANQDSGKVSGSEFDVENGLMRACFIRSQQRARVEPAHLAERRGRLGRLFGLHSPTARAMLGDSVYGSIGTTCEYGFPVRDNTSRTRLLSKRI